MRTSRRVPAAVYRSRGRVEVEERELSEPGAGQVLVEVDFCGVCGSDLHLIEEGWGRPGDVLGHEWSGTVVAVGGGVEDLAPGDDVVGGPDPRCGRCRACRDGLPAQCEEQGDLDGHFDGAFTTHVVRDRTQLVAVPQGLDRRAAALAEPLAVALHAITRSNLRDGDPVMVLGAGPIGALVAAVLVGRGHRVVAVEPAPARQELAGRLGAASVRHPDDLVTFDMAQVDTLADEAFPVVFETSGRRSAMESGYCQLGRGGTLVLVGTGMEQPSFDPNRMIVLELSVRGAYVYDEGGFDDALALLAAGTLPVDVLVDAAEYGLDGVAEAAARLARGEHAGKVMIRPNGGPP